MIPDHIAGLSQKLPWAELKNFESRTDITAIRDELCRLNTYEKSRAISQEQIRKLRYKHRHRIYNLKRKHLKEYWIKFKAGSYDAEVERQLMLL